MTDRTASPYRWILMLVGLSGLLTLGACERNITPKADFTAAQDPDLNPVEVVSMATDSSAHRVANVKPYASSSPMAGGQGWKQLTLEQPTTSRLQK